MSDSAALREHLQTILASPGFANADRLRRFLQFAVDAHMKGESGQIKEYVLGREVFDRDDNYDPRLDPIVRVEARRLRQRLAEYYAGPGRADKLRIDFPKGSYAPTVSAPQSTRKAGPWILALTVAAVAAAAFFFIRPTAPADAIAIVPARWMFVDPSGLDPSDEPLAEAIAAQVANRGKIPVIGWPSILPFRRNPKPGAELAKTINAAMVLAISVRVTGAQFRVTAFLVEPFTGRKRWVEDFYAQDLKTPDAVRTLAQTIAHDLEGALGK
jgi:serine/threonine-protein kinase